MKKNLYFIRHCESIANEKNIMQGCSDYELSENGKKQAIYIDYISDNFNIALWDLFRSIRLIRSIKNLTGQMH